MANALILPSYNFDRATLAMHTGFAAAAGFPLANLQHYDPAKVFRSTATSTTFTVDFGTGIIATSAAMIGGNLSASAAWTISASNSSASATITVPAFSTATSSMWIGTKPTTLPFPAAFMSWTNTTAYRYWGFQIVDPAPVAAYLELGRGMLDATWQPTLNLDKVGKGYFSADIASRGAYNQSLKQRRGSTGRTFDLTFSTVSQAEARQAAVIARQQGAGGDMFFSVDPTSTSNFAEESAQVEFSSMPRFDDIPLFTTAGQQYWSFRAGLAEIL